MFVSLWRERERRGKTSFLEDLFGDEGTEPVYVTVAESKAVYGHLLLPCSDRLTLSSTVIDALNNLMYYYYFTYFYPNNKSGEGDMMKSRHVFKNFRFRQHSISFQYHLVDTRRG